MFDDYILMNVAPVDATSKEIDPRAIADDVIRCADAGCAMVHLHVRDSKGNLTSKLDCLDETISLIKEKSDIIIEVSTGGVSNLTIKERCAPLYDCNVECCSLNVGSVNLGPAVYCNPIADVKYCVSEIIKTGKTPEVEVFEIGMIDTMIRLQKEFSMADPLLYSIVLGHEGACPATKEALRAMVSFIPPTSYWGITHVHRSDDSLIETALKLGARTVRVGFEDSHVLEGDVTSRDNYGIAKHLAQLIGGQGKKLMTPSMARKWLGRA